MIISFSSNENSIVLHENENIDLLCFFSVPHAIHAHESLWWDSLCTSLRLKRSVLILEGNITQFPVYDSSQRWQASDNWSWLSPRSLSVISAAYSKSPMSFSEFKTFLKSSK